MYHIINGNPLPKNDVGEVILVINYNNLEVTPVSVRVSYKHLFANTVGGAMDYTHYSMVITVPGVTGSFSTPPEISIIVTGDTGIYIVISES